MALHWCTFYKGELLNLYILACVYSTNINESKMTISFPLKVYQKKKQLQGNFASLLLKMLIYNISKFKFVIREVDDFILLRRRSIKK